MWKDAHLAGLTERCRRQDTAAQRAWYIYCYAYGINVALYYSGSREEAEEILQDSFVKVFHHFARGQPVPEQHRSWFRRVVINTAIDYYRRQRRDREIDPPPAGVSYNGAVESLNTEDLYRLLQELPPAYRLTFNLHVLEGYTHSEIADRLHITIGTSKSNLHKARIHLRQLAGPYFNLDNKLSNA